MNSDVVDGLKEIEIDADRLESINAIPNEDSETDAIKDILKSKTGELVADFDLEGVLTLAFPWIFGV